MVFLLAKIVKPKNFDVKTIFASRETIIDDLFTFAQQQLQQLQQQTFKQKIQTFNEICHRKFWMQK